MLQKRLDQDIEERTDTSGTLVALETARSASASATTGVRGKKDEPKEEEKISLFWRVFGGTILSIVALVVITLYNNIATTISELRSDLSREREARAGLAKKDEMDTRSKAQYDRIRVVEGYKADIEAVKERVTANGAAVEVVRKDLGASIDVLKKDTAGIDVLKERVTAVEAVKKELAGVDVLKEKLAGLTADLKTAREEVQKAQQELEKNKAADLERKSAHDAQAKQLDETIKDLQKNVQASREKIARLEGARPESTSAPAGRSKADPPKGDE
ncbi:MAG: hypothetical protein JWO38_5870 [Gemmataceae bacterium]|nr:hypothetical protein [Gemmataceae bacterium]